MRSMTGFGRGVIERGEVRVVADVRAVNHRFLDLKLRGTAVSPALEDEIGGAVRAAVERGAIVVALHVARAGAGGATRIDLDAARGAHRALSELAGALGLPGPELALVLAQPGVVVAEDHTADDATVSSAVVAAVAAALGQLDAMRATEGVALAAELAARLDELDAARARISELAAGLPPVLARRLAERIKRLGAEQVVEEARLAQEVALHADRADVTEELVRLASHLAQARALIRGPGAVGRRLDFLSQEIGRELNTIGAKSALSEISSEIVAAKAALEKLREQVQNVE